MSPFQGTIDSATVCGSATPLLNRKKKLKSEPRKIKPPSKWEIPDSVPPAVYECAPIGFQSATEAPEVEEKIIFNRLKHHIKEDFAQRMRERELRVRKLRQQLLN